MDDLLPANFHELGETDSVRINNAGLIHDDAATGCTPVSTSDLRLPTKSALEGMSLRMRPARKAPTCWACLVLASPSIEKISTQGQLLSAYSPFVSAITFGPRTFGSQVRRPPFSSESKWKPTSR